MLVNKSVSKRGRMIVHAKVVVHSVLKLVELFRSGVPLVHYDDTLVLELILRLAVHQIKDGIQVFPHLGISCLKGLNTVFIDLHAAFVTGHIRRQVQTLRLKPEVKLLEVLLELLTLLRHLMMCVGRMIVVYAEIDKFDLHFIYDFPAFSLVLFLEILCVGF